MIKGIYAILLLVGSNVFMTIAWYGHLRFKEFKFFEEKGLFFFIFISWLIAFFEYCMQVPANKIGHSSNDGPFNLMQLKIIQEVISLLVFMVFTLLIFKNESIKWNHIAAFLCILGAVFFMFKK